MPAVGTTYTADTWEQLRVKVVYAFDAANGRMSVDGVWYPKLSNAQALALMQALRGQLVAHKISPSTDWDVWYGALGYHQAGDKFDLTTVHGGAPAPADVVAGAWSFFESAAKRLDYVGALPKILALNLTYPGYEKAAHDAYGALVAERKRQQPKKTPVPMPPGIDPPVVEPPKPPDDVPLPIVPTPDGSTALLALLVLLGVAISMRKKRN